MSDTDTTWVKWVLIPYRPDFIFTITNSLKDHSIKYTYRSIFQVLQRLIATLLKVATCLKQFFSIKSWKSFSQNSEIFGKKCETNLHQITFNKIRLFGWYQLNSFTIFLKKYVFESFKTNNLCHKLLRLNIPLTFAEEPFWWDDFLAFPFSIFQQILSNNLILNILNR